MNPIQPAVTRDPKTDGEPCPASPPTAAATHGGALAERLHLWLLRGGLAFVLSYAALSSLVHPETFAAYFPSFIPDRWATQLLTTFAVFETLLVIGLMTSRYTYVAATLAGLTMVAIIAVNPDAFDVLFRNVAIAGGAFALAAQTRRERGERPSSWRKPVRATSRRSSPLTTWTGVRGKRSERRYR